MILIVGAGPTGLALAIELQRRGVAYRLIERAAERSDKSRALAVQARSLELMRGWGVSDALVARGQTTQRAEMFVEKQHATTAGFSDIGVDDTPYPYLLFVSQVETERACEAALERLGGRVERPVTLTAAHERGDGVDVELQHRDGRVERARVDWVVGCDGAHSVVRRAAGLEFEGGRYEQDFILADLQVRWDRPEVLHFFFGRGANAVLVPLGGGLWRIIGLTGKPLPPEGAGDEPPLGEFEALLGAVCPFAFALEAPRWLARFRLHHRGVARYRAGRFLVAGDAAHIHSPAGGQGMNTGIQDAINLGWKLALVAEGRASAALLDSYDEERRPVGRRLLQFTDRLFAALSSLNPLVVWLRNRLIPFAAPRMMATAARRQLAFRFVSQLGITYRGSSITGDEAGERAPDAVVAGKHLYDSFASTRHHLVVFGDPAFARAAEARWGELIDTVIVDDATARTRYHVDGQGWVLVRPDGYVGARAGALDDAGLDAYFGSRIGIRASKRST